MDSRKDQDMPIPPVTAASANTQTAAAKPKKLWKNPVRDTGYAGAAFGVASAVAACSKNIKLHKQLAYLCGIFTLAHIGIVEDNKYKWAKQNAPKA